MRLKSILMIFLCLATISTILQTSCLQNRGQRSEQSNNERNRRNTPPPQNQYEYDFLYYDSDPYYDDSYYYYDDNNDDHCDGSHFFNQYVKDIVEGINDDIKEGEMKVFPKRKGKLKLEFVKSLQIEIATSDNTGRLYNFSVEYIKDPSPSKLRFVSHSYPQIQADYADLIFSKTKPV